MAAINKQKSNWVIDAALFLGFMVAMFGHVTGAAVHEWLGVAVIVVSVYHLLVHWKWVGAISGQFFGRLRAQTRIIYLVDAGLFVGFLSMGITGLIISSWLNLPLDDYLNWKDIHVISSIVSLVLVVVKIGLHWRWIVNVSTRSLVVPSVPPTRSTVQPASATIGRREFLRLMGVVGATAVVAGGTALTELSTWNTKVSAQAAPAVDPMDRSANPSSTVVAQSSASPTPTPSSTSTLSKTPAATSSGTTSTPTILATSPKTSSECAPVCPNGCSYPGKCRRYVDSNGNGRCDLGEC